MSNSPDRRDPELEIAALRERLSRLGQASLRITQDLDFTSVLQGPRTPLALSPTPV